MDLIYMNENKVELGILRNFSLDLDIGVDDDFEITVGKFNNVLKYNYIFYIPDTEYGGIVDTIKSDTRSSRIYYSGRTWRGILSKKIIEPLPGDDYYVVTGDANEIIDEMIGYVELDGLFKVAESLSDININNFSFNRYVSLLKGLNSMLATKNARLKVRFNDGFVELSAEPVQDMSDELEFTDDANIEFVAVDKRNQVNHLICLGQGELSEREVIHLYVDKSGNIGNTQYYFDMEEVVDVYDYSSAESIEELRKGGIERLKEIMNTEEIDANVSDTELELGDVIAGSEEVTGIKMQAVIQQKILRINNNIAKIEYKVGD